MDLLHGLHFNKTTFLHLSCVHPPAAGKRPPLASTDNAFCWLHDPSLLILKHCNALPNSICDLQFEMQLGGDD